MKKAICFGLFISALFVSWACNSNSSTSNPYSGGSSPTATPNPTVVSAAVTIKVIAGPAYALSTSSSALSVPITITHGQSVQWDSSSAAGHPLNIDNGSNSCMVSGNTTFPFTQTFNTAGDYQFHCGVHSSCGNGSCPGTCTGLMVGMIHVN